MHKVALATIYHDPSGSLPARIEELWAGVADTFAGLAVVVTQAAPDAGIQLLESFGARLVFEDHPPAGLGGIGRGRREAVVTALEASVDAVLYADFDHVLRWGEHDPMDLRRTLEHASDFDFCVVGRTRAALDALPATLRETESIVNHVFSVVAGRTWDVLSGVRVLSRSGAEAIAACSEDSVANDVVWPLFALRAGLSVGYVESPGLVYEDDTQFATREEPTAWKARLESDPRKWAMRLRLALMDVEAMLPYGDVR